MSSRKWGGGVSSSEKSAHIKKVKVFPCLDVLYSKFMPQHCDRCTDDTNAGVFTRKRASFVVGLDVDTNTEKLYRIRYQHAEELAQRLALGSADFGAMITILNDELVVNTRLCKTGPDAKARVTPDSRAAIAEALVDQNYTMLTEGVRFYMLAGSRPAPYILMYHEECSPSDKDVKAYEEGYSEDYLQYLDRELIAALDERL